MNIDTAKSNWFEVGVKIKTKGIGSVPIDKALSSADVIIEYQKLEIAAKNARINRLEEELTRAENNASSYLGSIIRLRARIARLKEDRSK